MIKTVSKKLANLPTSPGVYLFKNKRGRVIYIGKSGNLKNRVRSYFNKGAKFSSATKSKMLSEIADIEIVKTTSEIEALLKEAELIKKYRPRFNILMRDDKSYSFVGITREIFPKIFVTHQPVRFKAPGDKKAARIPIEYIGPFTDAGVLKNILRLLRKIFPYCTCPRPHKRPCLNSQISRCFRFCCAVNPSPRAADVQKYRDAIFQIKAVLSARQKNILRSLKLWMRNAVREQDYERAAELRDQIRGLENIFAHRSFLAPRKINFQARDWSRIGHNIKGLLALSSEVSRVEGYDIANIRGQEATGSMVVFVDGLSVKDEYRKFKIKTVVGPNDTGMLKEVLSRRLNHPEWPQPDLLLIDGGTPQLGAAVSALKKYGLHGKIGLVALAKKEEELYLSAKKPPLQLKRLPPPVLFFFQRVRDEAHRFSRKYHHKLRELKYRDEA